MNVREQRGKELAERVNIQPVGKGVGKWIVPSQTGNGRYTVDLNNVAKMCTCPDYEQRRCKCKHVYAVEYTISRQRKTETNRAGETTVTETLTATKRTTYKQNWPAYNAAQTQEKSTFQTLLHDLCTGIKEPVQTFGRPRHSQADLIFSATFKVYSTVSCRRFTSDLTDAHSKGYVSKAPHYNSVFRCLEDEHLTPILHKLITRSSLPLKAVETDFTVDSSGFSTCKTVTWFNTRYGHEQDNQDWLKLHLMCGVKTNVVTSVEVSGRYDHDSPFFPPLVDATAQNFKINEVSADKAYSASKNLRVVEKHGGTAYIPFKSNATGVLATGEPEDCQLWRKMYHFYNFNRPTFLEHYHKRSNVESTFSMIKAKFGGALRSKSEPAITNEALCKVLCHNICCVIQSMHELGIEPDFGAIKNDAAGT